MASCRPASTIFLILLSSLALLCSSLQAAHGASKEEYLASGEQKQGSRSPTEENYVPVRRVVYRSAAALPAAVVTSEAYEPFQVCDRFRCRAAWNASMCVDTSCCYAIDCDIPGKPFGVCAFTPRACGCGAYNCTQQPS